MRKLIQLRYKQNFNNFRYNFSIISYRIDILVYINKTFNNLIMAVGFKKVFIAFYLFG